MKYLGRSPPPGLGRRACSTAECTTTMVPGGTWSTTKLSKFVGAQSLTMDPATGEVDAVVGGFESLQLFSKPAAGGWTHKMLTSDFASSAVVRRNPATGGLLVAFVHETLDGDDPSTVQVMTKG